MRAEQLRPGRAISAIRGRLQNQDIRPDDAEHSKAFEFATSDAGLVTVPLRSALSICTLGPEVAL